MILHAVDDVFIIFAYVFDRILTASPTEFFSLVRLYNGYDDFIAVKYGFKIFIGFTVIELSAQIVLFKSFNPSLNVHRAIPISIQKRQLFGSKSAEVKMAHLQFYRAYYDCKNCGNQYYFLIMERDTKVPCARCNSDNSPTRQVKMLLEWIHSFIDLENSFII